MTKIKNFDEDLFPKGGSDATLRTLAVEMFKKNVKNKWN